MTQTVGFARPDNDSSEPRRSAHLAVLVPARNESAIFQTLASIAQQTLLPDVVVVVLNNCSDGGETRRAVAEADAAFPSLRLTVLEMLDNPERKAGALNHGFAHLCRDKPGIRWVVQMDADSLLDATFLAETVGVMEKPENWRIAALSCAFTGRSDLDGPRWSRVVMWHQRVEYASYHDAGVARNVSVVSGTGCLLSVDALKALQNERGYVWHGDSLVEDFELTLALRKAGWETRKSQRFKVYTDLMPTLSDLVQQRLRWQRGTFEELRRYGGSAGVWMERARQWLHGVGLLLNVAGWTLVAVALAAGHFVVQPVFLALIALISLRRAYHARALGWRTVLAVATLLPDQAYGLVRNYWWVKSLVLSFTTTRRAWT